jgi:type III pantothenate kinase
VAAFSRHKKACIVVDFGTATTFDYVSETGDYMGGIIAPGANISAEALFRQASKLPRVEIVKPPTVIGKNTVAAMQSGIFFGYVALVEGIIERMKRELRLDPLVIATGGLACTIASESSKVHIIDENLTLEGLRIIYERNLAPGP